jgi:hypothetical protein
MEVVMLLEPFAVGEAGILDVDPAETGGLDDERLVYLGDAGGRVEIADRIRSAEPRAWKRRQVRHGLGGFIWRSAAS